MTSGATESGIRGSDDPKSSCLQLERLHQRVRLRLEELRSEVDAPATHALLDQLDPGRTGELQLGVSRVIASLNQALVATEAAAGLVERELLRLSGEETSRLGVGLPPGLRRFVEEGAKAPGFSFEIDRDPDRGATVRWVRTSADGTIRGSGALFEHPHGWIEEG